MSVFVSFEPRETTAPVVLAACRAAGLDVWSPEQARVADKNVVQARRSAISQADAFISVLGPSYSDSVLCVNELKLARRAGVPRAAVVVGDSNAQSALMSTHDITAVRGLNEPDLAGWLSALSSAPRPQTPAPTPTPAATHSPAPARKSDNYFFINFSGGDRSHLDYLSQELRRANIPFWDFLQGNRKLQEPLAHEIEDIISNSAGVLSVVTSRWRASQWSLREYLFARQIGLPTFLLLFEPIPPTLIISERTFIDFTLPDRAAALAQLATEVNDVRTERQTGTAA